jgi:hypothetical protein
VNTGTAVTERPWRSRQVAVAGARSKTRLFTIRSINVIKRNSSKFKYVEIFTHHVGSIGAPSRRTVFVRGTSAEQRESPDIIILIII